MISLEQYEKINDALNQIGKKHDLEDSANVDFIEGTYNGIVLCLQLLGLKTRNRTSDGVVQLMPENVE